MVCVVYSAADYVTTRCFPYSLFSGHQTACSVTVGGAWNGGGALASAAIGGASQTTSVLLSAVKPHLTPLGGQSPTAEVGEHVAITPVRPVTTTTMALSNDPNYKKLEEWYKAKAGSLNMRDMFAADRDRFIKFRLEELFTSVRGQP